MHWQHVGKVDAGLAEAGAESGGGRNGDTGRSPNSDWRSRASRRVLKRGAGYVPLTLAAIRLVVFFECGAFDNERLLGRSAICCDGGGVLRVMHCRTVLD